MPFSENVDLIAYHDLEGHPSLKCGLHEVNERFYLYSGGLWHSGWSILDVTNPLDPQYVRWIPGPPNTQTWQIQIAGNRMITGIGPVPAGWGGDPKGPPAEEGITIWDLSTPDSPVQLGHWHTGARGTHRNYYDGGRYVHAATSLPGFDGEIYAILDIDDPEHPVVVGRWWWPGQNVAAGETYSPWDKAKAEKGRPHPGLGVIWLHGGPYVEGERVYCGWARAGMVVLDISEITQPRLAGNLSFYPPLGSTLAAHTVVPIPERQIAIVNSEALHERCREPLAFAGVVDISDEADPMLISLFPVPEPPVGYPVGDFAAKGGRFGPHNQHQPQHQPGHQQSGDYVYLTYFNAGLQIFDITNPRMPKIAGYYIPDDPVERIGPLPEELVVQIEDVIVDRRGFIYVTEKNSGVYICEFNPAEKRGARPSTESSP